MLPDRVSNPGPPLRREAKINMAALPPLKVNPFTLITEFQIWGVADIIFFIFIFLYINIHCGSPH